MSTQSIAHSRFICLSDHPNPSNQQELNEALAQAFNDTDMFKVRDLLHEGADPNFPITLTEQFAYTKVKVVHPGNLLEEIMNENTLDLIRSFGGANLVTELLSYKADEYVPTSLLKELATISSHMGLGMEKGEVVSAMAIALAMQDHHLVEDLLVHGADVSEISKLGSFEYYQITSELFLANLRISQLLIDHGVPFEAFMAGINMEGLILTNAVAWKSLELMEFIAHNLHNLPEILNKTNEAGISLYDHIKSTNEYDYQIMQLLSDVKERAEIDPGFSYNPMAKRV